MFNSNKFFIGSSALAPDGTSKGKLFAWGKNDTAQVGNGGISNVLTPTRIGTDNWKVAAAGGGHNTTASATAMKSG